jgi:hypothetical protein
MKNSFIAYCVVILLLITGLTFESGIQSRKIISLTVNSHAEKITSIKNINNVADLFEVNNWLCVYSGAESEDIVIPNLI